MRVRCTPSSQNSSPPCPQIVLLLSPIKLSPAPISIDNMTTPHVDDAFLLHLVAISAPTNLPLYPVMVRDQTFTVIIDNGASDNYVSQWVVTFADAITTVQGTHCGNGRGREQPSKTKYA
jgi:hypothetical protein